MDFQWTTFILICLCMDWRVFLCTCEMIKNISHTTNHCYWFIACTHFVAEKKCFIIYLKGKINISANMNNKDICVVANHQKIKALNNLSFGQKFLNLFIIPHALNVFIESLAHILLFVDLLILLFSLRYPLICQNITCSYLFYCSSCITYLKWIEKSF